MSDLRFEDHGSLLLLRPLTNAGGAWLLSTAPTEVQYWGNALVVEPRFAAGVVQAAVADGLEVEGA